MIFEWILEQNSFFRERSSFGDLYNVVITRCSFHTATNDIFEGLSHAEKLDSIGFKVIEWLVWKGSRIIKTLRVSYVVVEGLSLFEFGLFLFEFESERVLESIESGWELGEFFHFELRIYNGKIVDINWRELN